MKHKSPSGYPAYKPMMADLWRVDDEGEKAIDGRDIYDGQRKARLKAMEIDEMATEPLTHFGVTENVVRQIRSQSAAGMSLWRIAEDMQVTWDTVNRVVMSGVREAEDE